MDSTVRSAEILASLSIVVLHVSPEVLLDRASVDHHVGVHSIEYRGGRRLNFIDAG